MAGSYNPVKPQIVQNFATMDMPVASTKNESTPKAPEAGGEKNTLARTPSIIVGLVATIVVALSLFYLLRPEPLLVQGEADATRLDIAAQVDGRVKEVPVERGQNVACGRRARKDR